MLSLYAKLSSLLLAAQKRASGCTHAKTVCSLARLEIVPMYYQELVSHPMPVC